MNIRIIVATHKKYWMPNDEMYYPLHVGHSNKNDIGYPGDDRGDHISEKNANYCELTGLYWAWKNLNADYLGIAHYRRHFSVLRKGDMKQRVLTKQQAEVLMKQVDIVLPKPRNYNIYLFHKH